MGAIKTPRKLIERSLAKAARAKIRLAVHPQVRFSEKLSARLAELEADGSVRDSVSRDPMAARRVG